MLEIFDKFIDKIYSGDMKLIEAYADMQQVSMKWVTCNFDETIQERVNNICDDLEQEGFDLEITPIEKIRERFAACQFSLNVPEEYTSLKDSLDFVKEVEMKSSGKIKEQIQDAILKIELEMKKHA
jgi:hypothetical protein